MSDADKVMIERLKELLKSRPNYSYMTLSVSDGTRLLALAEQGERAVAIIAAHDLCHDLHGKVGRDEFEEGCRLEAVKEFGSCGWAEKITNLQADLANERAVRDRRELAVNRALAKARPYTHPGTNAGTHQVLSEIVSILEGKGG